MKNIKISIKYFTDDIEPIEKINCGDWIDLRAAEMMVLRKGQYALIPLGIGMKLPKGYEAHVVPRSSTYKRYHIIQTNGIGVIDESYCGDNDQWYMPVIAMKDTIIHINDRICQFRLFKHQPNIIFERVKKLDDNSRGGFGSTGR